MLNRLLRWCGVSEENYAAAALPFGMLCAMILAGPVLVAWGIAEGFPKGGLIMVSGVLSSGIGTAVILYVRKALRSR